MPVNKRRLALAIGLLGVNLVACATLLTLAFQPSETETSTAWQLPTSPATPLPLDTPTLGPTNTPLPTNTPTPTEPATETPILATTPSQTTEPQVIMYVCGYDRCHDSGEYGQLIFETGINVWNNHDPERGGIHHQLKHHDQVIIAQEIRVDEGPGRLWYELSDGGWINDLWLTTEPCTTSNLEQYSFADCLMGDYGPDTPESPPSSTQTSSLTIQGTTDHVSSTGTYYVFGEVVNHSNQSVEFVKVVGSFYDATGRLLTTDFTYAELEIIEAGGRSPFSLGVLDPPSGIESYKLDMEWSQATDFPLRVAILSHGMTKSDIGTYHIVGEIHNSHDFAVDFVKIIVTCYNTAGDVVCVDYTYTELEVVGSGQRSPFDIGILEPPSDLDHYSLQTEATRH